ncbi:anthranilate synthase component I [Halobacteriales archaeon SW_5_70_135]|nr:MAG: anthranilate synthase component I [Halobacteriales archaeon SW_5_70_135]
MIAPETDRETFVSLAEGDRPAVVRLRVDLDVEATPLSAYAALTGRTVEVDAVGDPGYAFLLESAGKTPSSDPDGAFRADSADRHARYSFVGYDPLAAVRVRGGETDVEPLGDHAVLDRVGTDSATGDDRDAFDALRTALPDVRLAGFDDEPLGARAARPRLNGGLVGFCSYDAVYATRLAEVGLERPETRTPDAGFVLATRVLAIDHREGTVELVATPPLSPGASAGETYDAVLAEAAAVRERLATAEAPAPAGARIEREEADPRETYERAVERAREAVLDGEVYQCVLSRSRRLYGDVDPLGLYAALRRVNPSPYMYLLGFDDLRVVGASPETLVSVAGDRVTANPIAGTCPRGASPVEDRRLAGELLADDKERAEHTMLVDLARNDVRRVAAPGSVEVEEFMNVLKYSHVQHIESTVSGRLAGGPTEAVDRAPDAFDATRAAFPAGTLTGAPKVRAMELIDDTEDEPRGVYGGGVGYYDWTGDADVAIVIRTATVEQGVAPAADGGDDRDRVTGGDDRDRVTVRAGAGVVADSDPESEFAETERKMRGTLDALDRVRVDVDDATAAETAEDPVEGRAESAGGDPA